MILLALVLVGCGKQALKQDYADYELRMCLGMPGTHTFETRDRCLNEMRVACTERNRPGGCGLEGLRD